MHIPNARLWFPDGSADPENTAPGPSAAAGAPPSTGRNSTTISEINYQLTDLVSRIEKLRQVLRNSELDRSTALEGDFRLESIARSLMGYANDIVTEHR